MGTRQYVGARYVPTFANPIQWDNQRIYEPLTMVTYLNNTYTSKKPVPQGVDINDKEYWALTGNYNAQVEQYRQEVETLNQRVTDVNYKNVIIIGDSYGVASADWGATTPYPVLVKQYLGYDDTKFYYKALDGAGFANGLFLSNLKSVNVLTPINITDIYVLGGWNDQIGRSEITGTPITPEMVTNAMTEFRNYCWEKYPNANVHVIFLAWRFGEKLPGTFWQTKHLYLNANKFDFICHTMMQYVCHNKAFMGRGEYYDHPNQLGQEAIANALANTIKNGDSAIIYDFAVQPSQFKLANNINWNGNDSGIFVFQQFLNNSVIHNEFFVPGDNLLITHTDSTTFELAMNGTDYVEIASYEGGLSTGQDKQQSVPVLATLISSAETPTIHITAKLIFEGGKMFIHFPYFVNTPNTANPTSITPHTIILSGGSGNYSANLS